MKDATEILVILDKSGSMESIKKGTIEGINSFIAEQKTVKGECYFTLVMFNQGMEVVFERMPMSYVHPINTDQYQTSGTTALLDAVGKSIDTLGAQLKNISENDRPDKVLVIIITDGKENCSQKFILRQISEKIQCQESEFNWKFIFMGANQDSWATAQNIGIKNKAAVMDYAHTDRGVRIATHSVSEAAVQYRAGTGDGSLNTNKTN